MRMSKNKQRILSISHYYVTDNRGGGEVMLHEILKSLVAAGYSVDAVVTDVHGPIVQLDGVTIYRGKEYLAKLDKSYNLVVSQFQEADAALARAAELGIPTVYVAHNNMDPTKHTLKTSNPSLVIFNTDWLARYYKYVGQSIVLHPPVYSQAHATVHGDMITLVNLIPSKGFNMFYHMAMRHPRTKFLGVEGGYYKSLQQTIPLRNIEYIKNTDDMKRDVWSRTKILLMPSSYESYGMAGVEAMASGIPVIASSTPGLRESLGYGGIFPANNSILAWRQAISGLLVPENYQRASDLALRRSAEIDPKIELKQLVKTINSLLG